MNGSTAQGSFCYTWNSRKTFQVQNVFVLVKCVGVHKWACGGDAIHLLSAMSNSKEI